MENMFSRSNGFFLTMAAYFTIPETYALLFAVLFYLNEPRPILMRTDIQNFTFFIVAIPAPARTQSSNYAAGDMGDLPGFKDVVSWKG